MATSTWQELYKSWKNGEFAPGAEIDFGGKVGKVLAADFLGEAERAFQTATQWHQRNAEHEKALIARENEFEDRVRAATTQPAAHAADGGAEFSDLPEAIQEAARLDSYWRAQARLVSDMRKEIRRVEEENKKTWAAAQQWVWQNHHLATLNQLRGRDKNLDQDKLLTYALQHNISDLNSAYDLMTRPTAVEQARKEGYESGMKEGQEKAAAAYVPSGLRRPTVSPMQGEAPKDMFDLKEKAMQDPEVVKAFVQDLEGAPTE